MNDNLKYAVYPGFVTSRYDGDLHYVDSNSLMRLHGVVPQECIVVRGRHSLRGLRKRLISLFPREDGHYHNYGVE